MDIRTINVRAIPRTIESRLVVLIFSGLAGESLIVFGVIEVLDEVGAHVDAVEIFNKGFAVEDVCEIFGVGVSAFVDFGVEVGAVEVVGGEDVVVFLVALVRLEGGQIN
jgi:hypothetical protein